MQTKYKVMIITLVALGSFAVGRFAAPTKVVTKTVEVEKQVAMKDDKKEVVDHSKKKITIVKKPDGTETDTIMIVSDIDTKQIKNDMTTTDVSESKETTKTYDTSKVTLSALAGFDLSRGTVVYGGSLTKPVLGPITIGIFGLTNSSCGVSVGLTF